MRPTLILVFALVVTSIQAHEEPNFDSKNEVNQTITELKKTGDAFSFVSEEASDAVVFVRVVKKVGAPQSEALEDLFGDELLERFFGRNFRRRDLQPKRERQSLGQGSGFFITQDGYILTNHHVVNQADEISVQLKDGRNLPAKLIGADPDTDVAVIKVKGQDFPSIAVGDSDKIKVGEWALAIGNPFGLKQTVTVGVVSAKGRSNVGITNYENFIQTDAAINPGNSGGPLLNLEGEVIGINSAIYSRSGGYMGIGFAIPINLAMKIYNQLLESGTVSKGFIGVIIQDLTPELAKSFKLEKAQGALISQVEQNSPAQRAGLQEGDVIVAVAGKKILDFPQLRNEIAFKPPGTQLQLDVIRNGKKMSVTVVLGSRDKLKVNFQNERDSLENKSTSVPLGFSARNMTALEAKAAGQDRGVIVTDVVPGSQAALSGMSEGNLILEVNRLPVDDINDLAELIKEAREEDFLLLKIQQGRLVKYVTLKF